MTDLAETPPPRATSKLNVSAPAPAAPGRNTYFQQFCEFSYLISPQTTSRKTLSSRNIRGR